jgi:hypothetical protein
MVGNVRALVSDIGWIFYFVFLLYFYELVLNEFHFLYCNCYLMLFWDCWDGMGMKSICYFLFCLDAYEFYLLCLVYLMFVNPTNFINKIIGFVAH